MRYTNVYWIGSADLGERDLEAVCSRAVALLDLPGIELDQRAGEFGDECCAGGVFCVASEKDNGWWLVARG